MSMVINSAGISKLVFIVGIILAIVGSSIITALVMSLWTTGSSGLQAPDYDSGWISPEGYSTIFEHGLGTTKVLVQMIGRNLEGSIHQRRYGGDNTGGGLQGTYWCNLTDSTIQVNRLGEDGVAYWSWDQIRIMIWKIP